LWGGSRKQGGPCAEGNKTARNPRGKSIRAKSLMGKQDHIWERGKNSRAENVALSKKKKNTQVKEGIPRQNELKKIDWENNPNQG